MLGLEGKGLVQTLVPSPLHRPQLSRHTSRPCGLDTLSPSHVSHVSRQCALRTRDFVGLGAGGGGRGAAVLRLPRFRFGFLFLRISPADLTIADPAAPAAHGFLFTRPVLT